MFVEQFEASVTTPLWRFGNKKGTQTKTEAILLEEKHFKEGRLTVARRCYEVAGGKAVRLFVTSEESFALVAECLTVTEPCCVYTTFSWQAGPDLCCNVADKNRLVFRADGRGAKLFRLVAQTDGADTLEQGGLLLPDGLEAESVRFTPYAGLYSFGQTQINVFAVAEDSSTAVKGWHMTAGETVEITAPDKLPRLRAVLHNGAMTVSLPHTGDVLTVTF